MFLGTDPEFFITDGKGGFLSASEFFPLKDKPFRPTSYNSMLGTGDKRFKSWGQSSIFRDGFAVEVNVPPYTCRAELGHCLRSAIQDIKTLIQEKDKNFGLTSLPTIEVPLSYLRSLPEDVMKFGCDPAWNAYSEREERINLDGAQHGWRYAGGHMHFGFQEYSDKKDSPLFGENKRKEAFTLVKILDLTVGLPLSIIFHEKDEFERRKYYGKAGEFRYQPWGIEYRTPSPRIWNHNLISGFAFGVGRSVILNYADWKATWERLNAKIPSLEGLLQRAINLGEDGRELLQEVKYFYKSSHIDYIAGKGKEKFKLMDLTLDKIQTSFEYGYGNYLYEDGLSVLA